MDMGTLIGAIVIVVLAFFILKRGCCCGKQGHQNDSCDTRPKDSSDGKEDGDRKGGCCGR